MSNIPAEHLQVRDQLCAELGVDDADLPFAVELMDVAEEHGQLARPNACCAGSRSPCWCRRACTRACPSEGTRQLTARRSDGCEVGVRLVYERPLQRPQADGLLLADTIEIADSPLRGYLAKVLYARADHRCAEPMEEFCAADRAVTMQGQIRSRGWHVKDDRQSATDARGWAMAWRTEGRETALRARRAQLEREVAERAPGWRRRARAGHGGGGAHRADPAVGVHHVAGPGHRDGQAPGRDSGAGNPRLLLRSARPLVARLEREHQRPAAPVLPEKQQPVRP
ncbi:hypothetical protein ACWIDS_03595 [Dietzia maris]